jgi:hypothetical protein
VRGGTIESLLKVDPLLPPELADALEIGEGLSVQSLPSPSDGSHLLMLRLRYGKRCLTHAMAPAQAIEFARGVIAMASGPAPSARKRHPS